MTPKRKTLDDIGAHPRPRAYVDSFVVRRPTRVVDVLVPSKPPAVAKPTVAPDLEVEASMAARRTLDLVNRQSTVPGSQSKTTAAQRGSASVAPNPHSHVTTHDIPSVMPKSPQTFSEEERVTISDMVHAIQIGTSTAQKESLLYRQGDETDTADDNALPRKRFVSRFSQLFATPRAVAMSAMSLILMVGGTVALISSFVTNHRVDAQVQVLTEVASARVGDDESLASDEGLPSEDPVPEPVVNSYRPAADEPRYIYIPRLKNRKTRVLNMGLDKDGAIKTPRTTSDTGWFNGSSKPGDTVGASLIVGHVSGLTTGGVFYNLYRMENGDEIIVEMGDGTKYTYRVVAKEEVPLDGIDMNNYLVSHDVDKPGLTLMTCAGEYNPVTKTFDNRLAVFAVRDI